MILKIQILSLSYSFLYGIFFSFMTTLNYSLLYNDTNYIKIISSALFIVNNVLLYFILLQKINNGILHIYLIITFILGIVVEININKLIAKHIKK